MEYPKDIVGLTFVLVREGDPWHCCHVTVLHRLGQEVRCRLENRRWRRVVGEHRPRQRILAWSDLG